jgi:enoyl-CoA hydratase
VTDRALNSGAYERYRELRIVVDDGLATVTLFNPAKKNAVTPGMSVELVTIWEDLWIDPEVKVIVLTGEGDAFCAGVDIAARTARLAAEAAKDPGMRTPRPVNPVTRLARKHVMGILDCEKPVIAKVRGPAYGAGVNLALACDMVFAAPDARFCDSHVKVGMVAGDGGVLLWPLAIGFHRAKEYLMTGEPIAAEEAEKIGLINRCLPEAELDAHVEMMARKLIALPPHAVNYTKTSLNIALKQMTQSAFEASLAYEIYSMEMDDHREAGAAFVEKRPAKFTGQ